MRSTSSRPRPTRHGPQGRRAARTIIKPTCARLHAADVRPALGAALDRTVMGADGCLIYLRSDAANDAAKLDNL